MSEVIFPANAQPFYFEGGEHGVLLIHGFTGSISHMRPLGDALHAAGFTVRGINLPGHATRYQDMADCTWQTWLQYVKEAVMDLKKKCKYVSVCGLSMGGVLTLLSAQQMELTSAIPVSAPMGINNRLINISGLIWPFFPVTPFGNSPDRHLTHDANYDYGYLAFPTKAAVHLRKLMKMARRNLFNITCPLMVVQSDGDGLITQESGHIILDGIASKHKTALWLKEVPHVCTISKEKDHIAEEIIKFLKEAEKLSEKG